MNYRDFITIEPGKRGGKPCIRGMRITVSDVLGYLAAGMTEQEILSDFPYLTSNDIQACLSYAALNQDKDDWYMGDDTEDLTEHVINHAWEDDESAYDLDYSKAHPNRFAGNISEDRRVVLPPESEDVDEREWLQAAAKNEAFDFLNDPDEDIYTLADGKPLTS